MTPFDYDYAASHFSDPFLITVMRSVTLKLTLIPLLGMYISSYVSYSH